LQIIAQHIHFQGFYEREGGETIGIIPTSGEVVDAETKSGDVGAPQSG
jgi:hypothetical protein